MGRAHIGARGEPGRKPGVPRASARPITLAAHPAGPLGEVSGRDLDMVRVLLASDADLDRQGRTTGDTALMHGIFQSSARNAAPMEIARLLVAAGADVNLANKRGVTALLLAVQKTNPEGVAMVEALLARGADVDHRRCYGPPESPPGRPTRFRAVGGTALGLASAVGNTAAVQALLAAGADTDLPQCDGKTPLDLAMENGHEDVARICATRRLRPATPRRVEKAPQPGARRQADGRNRLSAADTAPEARLRAE